MTIQELMTDNSAFATTLLAVGLDVFGDELLKWEPQTVRLEYAEQFEAGLSEQNASKLNGLITALATDAFHTEIIGFSAVCLAIDGEEDITTADIPSPEQMAWAVTEVDLFDNDDVKYSSDVCCFVGEVLADSGIYQPPQALNFATYLKPAQWPTDDPEIYVAVYQRQKAESLHMAEHIKSNLMRLQQQLDEMVESKKVKLQTLLAIVAAEKSMPEDQPV
jgi:hypothetical protein